jgi:formiminotetrahydrofolate cyclodeaminase
LRDAEHLVDQDCEAYLNFSRSRQEGDAAEMERQFNAIVDVSMKILEKSETAFEWIRQLGRLVPPTMVTHLLVAGELLNAVVKGSIHVARANLLSTSALESRANYLKRLDALGSVFHDTYRNILQEIATDPIGSDRF